MLKTDRRALTLIEILVAATLLTLVTTLFLWFLVPTLRYTSRGTARADIQQMAILAGNKILADVKNSDIAGISIHPRSAADPSGPVVLALIPIDDVDPEGRRIWKPSVVVYYWERSSGHLFRKEWPPVPPGALSVDPLPTNRPSQLATVDLLTLATSTNGSERSIAGDVVHFDIRHTGSGTTLGQPLTFEISIEQKVPGQQGLERFDLTQTVTLRH